MTVCDKFSKTGLKGSKHEFTRKKPGHVYFSEAASHRYSSEAGRLKGGLQCRCPGVRRRSASFHFSPSAHRERCRRLERQGPNLCGLSHECGPRHVERRSV